MKNNLLFAIFLILLSTNIYSQSRNENLLLSICKFGDVKKQSSLIFQNNKSTVFVFLSPECPLCKNYIKYLNEIQQNNKEIQFISVFPGKSYNKDLIQKFVNTFGLKSKWVIDYKKEITKILNATVTPQVIVINSFGKIVYSGLIDDRIISLGSQRIIIKEKYLEDVLNRLSITNNIYFKSTKPIGCLINSY